MHWKHLYIRWRTLKFKEATQAKIKILQVEKQKVLSRANRLEKEKEEALAKVSRSEKEKEEVLTKATWLEKEKEEALTKATRLEKEKEEVLAKVSQLQKKAKKLNNELYNVKKGWSFRIGRVIAFVPRKIKSGFHLGNILCIFKS